MKKIIFISMFGLVAFSACSPTITKTISKSVAPLDYRKDVVVFDLEETAPDNSVEIGTIKIGDSGFTVNCGWEVVLENAKMEARKMGGDGLKITKHGLPNPFGSSCHRITANVLILDSIASSSSPKALAELPANIVKDTKPFPRFRLAFDGGYSYLTAPLSSMIPSELKNYSQSLKNGGQWGLEATYFFFEQMGVALKCNQFNTSNSISNINATYNDGSSYRGTMSDVVTINYYGVSYCSRYYNRKMKNCLAMSVGLGYMSYRDESVVGRTFVTTGNTLGSHIDIGYDIALGKNFAIGAKIAYLMGTLNEVDFSDGRTTKTIDRNDNNEGISQLNLSIGLRFNY